jgi:hypothetical protein
VSLGVGLAACDGGSETATVRGTEISATWTPIPGTQNYQLTVTAATSEWKQTATFTLEPAGTPSPSCPYLIPNDGVPFNSSKANETIYGAEQRKDAFLQAVLRYQHELPNGMTVSLLLAMGSAEKGVCSQWSQVNDPCNPGNADGILQLSPDNEFRYRSGYSYNDTYGGFEGNVRDAILFLKEISTTWRRSGIEDRFSNIPNGSSVKLLLYYNGGQNPVLLYANGGGNQQYLSHVAKYLEDSPFGCQYIDRQLASNLREAQKVLDNRVKEYKETGQ